MKAVDLYRKHTLKELEELNRKLSEDPENRETAPNSIYIHNKKTRKKMDEISWAITWKLRDMRIAKGETINESGYTGPKQKRRR